MKPRIVLHLTPDALKNWRIAMRFEFYRRLEVIAEEIGIELTAVRAQKTRGVAHPGMEDGNLHIAHGGKIIGRGWLNASMAYLPGFWHINPYGTLADSPASQDVFSPDDVKSRSAHAFYTKLQQTFSLARKSRYRQKQTITELPKNSVALVLQGRHPYANRQNYLTMEDMISEVLSTTESCPIIVKPHPLEPDLGLEAIKKFSSHRNRIVLTDANIHDVLSAARLVTSVNSSVTFEGFMHAKPSVVFGRCDFPSLVNTVRAQGEFQLAHDKSLHMTWDYPKMLYWYFKRHTVEVRSRKLKNYLSYQISAAGLRPEEFGMPIVQNASGSNASYVEPIDPTSSKLRHMDQI